MYRVLLVLMVSLSPMVCGATQLIQVAGQITGGQFLDPAKADPSSGPPPALDFPIPYSGLLSYEPETSQARFQFTANIDGAPIEHIIGSTFGNTFTGNLFPGILKFDASAIDIAYLSPFNTFITSFNLNLDRSTGQGEWQWHEECPVCFAALPAATATITSFSLTAATPEPCTATLVVVLSATFFARPIRRRR